MHWSDTATSNATTGGFTYHHNVDIFFTEDDDPSNISWCPVQQSFNNKRLYTSAYVTIAFSTASMVGSFFIILTYLLFRDLRTVARAILVFLAIADFFTAAGYLFGSVVYLHFEVNHNGTTNTSEYKYLCTAQSFVTTLFPISSFLWTTHLAIYLFVSIVLRKNELARRMLVLFHITAWGIPLVVCIPALATHNLGPASSRTSVSWCFIRFDSSYDPDTFKWQLTRYYILEFFCGKLWEILAYVTALVLYVSVKISLWRRKRKGEAESISYGSRSVERRVIAAVENLDSKLIFIPLVFIFVRIWGTIRFFMSFAPSCHFPLKGCTPPSITVTEKCFQFLYSVPIIMLQSAGDPAQGLGNAILFVLFQKTIFRRLCPCCFVICRRIKECCCSCCRKSTPVKEGAAASARDPLLPLNTSKEENHSPLTYGSGQKFN